MSKDKEILDNITEKEYEHGFVTNVEQEFIPKGLNEDIIRLISAKKDEPQWMLDFRLEAFRRWQKMKLPTWAHLDIPAETVQRSSINWAIWRVHRLPMLPSWVWWI